MCPRLCAIYHEYGIIFTDNKIEAEEYGEAGDDGVYLEIETVKW